MIESTSDNDISDLFVELLNSAFSVDQNAIHSLFVNRVPCNQELADHKFVEVMESPVLDGHCFQVGVLGIINGLLRSSGHRDIAMKFSEADGVGVKKIIGFCRAEKDD